jgi:hypothetical protein
MKQLFRNPLLRLRFLPISLTLFSFVLMFCLGMSMPPGTAMDSTQKAEATASVVARQVLVQATPSSSPATSPTPGATNEDEPADRLEVYMTVLNFDPVKGEVDARLEFMPYGKYQSGDTLLAAQNILLSTNNIDAQGSEFLFRENRRMDAKLIRVSISEGNANSYPFDAYQAEVDIYAESFKGKNDPENYQAVPLTFYTISNIPGFDINFSSLDKEEDPELIYQAIKIERSPTVRFFSLLVMMIMWLLATLAFLLSLRVWRSGKAPEVSMLGLMAALLFAFPAIRNTQPNVPPVGTTGDFLSFLWTELIVVFALVILGACWLRRYGSGELATK